MSEVSTCFHCGDPIPAGETRSVVIDGSPRPVCCAGCEAVASLIAGSGLENFYRYRTGPSARPQDPSDGPDEWDAFDRPRVQQSFVRELSGGQREAALLIENLSCAACAWLIDHCLRRLPGVAEVTVNPASGRALIRFDPAQVQVSTLMRNLARLGYRPHPVGAGQAESAAQRERHAALKRLVVAGFGMMQVMMFAVGLYFGAFTGIDEVYQELLRWVSWAMATPVLFYSAWPFYKGALRDLQARRVGMDVPVALGMTIAYLASCWQTLTRGHEVYFDSVTMFVFFLLVGRYVEMAARHKAAAATDVLTALIPPTARRVIDGAEERVAVEELEIGDVVAVRAGETVPADGRIVWGQSRFDESMLTGESLPQARGLGDTVVAGSLNVANPIQLRVEQTGQNTVLSTIGRLLDRAQAERPRLARVADWIAGRFVIGVLLIAAAVAAYWLPRSPEMALLTTVAVLVVSCPCALGLATPVALVAATSRLTREGLLTVRGDALENLAKVTHVVFDKTGTLTEGRIAVDEVRPLGALDADRCLRLAAALERHSEHPIAKAFTEIETDDRAEDVVVTAGAGLEGIIDGRRLRIGTAEFVAALSGAPLPAADQGGDSWIALGDERGVLALMRLADRVRPDTKAVLDELRGLGLHLEIASGDSHEAVSALAQRLGIRRFSARMTPADKLTRIRELQAAGAVVLMVGDGINDAPVLAGADVSAAMGSGTALAQTSAAMVLLGESLTPLVQGVRTARMTTRIIRENIGWALSYNATTIPLAAIGVLTPWMAAIGMSVSSLVVVINAMRLSRRRRTEVCPPAALPGAVSEVS